MTGPAMLRATADKKQADVRKPRSLTPQVVGDTLGALLKYQDDIARMQGDTLQKVLKEATSEN